MPAAGAQLCHEAVIQAAVVARIKSARDPARRLRRAGDQDVADGVHGDAPAGICFTRAEINDVILEADATKVAGAAMKRNKKGLLFQGSIWKPLLPKLDWDHFAEAFPAALAKLADAEIDYPGWPDFDPDEETALIDQYASPEWIEAR